MDKILKKPKIHGLVLCAGAGTRAGLGYNKVLHYVGRKTVLETALDAFSESCCKAVTVTAAEADIDAVRELTMSYKRVAVVLGGATRGESVRKGLEAIKSCDIVAIHDGARPFVTPDLINKTIESALNFGSGIAAVPAIDTIKIVNNGIVERTLPRSRLFHMQTPQTFQFPQIADAYARVTEDCTDDSEVYQKAGYTPRIVLGDYRNIKLTTEQDFLRPLALNSKIGAGFDVHPLVSGRPLMLGGVKIPYEKGLLGHSDADVLAHATMDALLSAAGLPDIGVLFPDTDPAFQGADSTELLRKVSKMVADRFFSVGNVSAVVMAEKPKLSPFIPNICRSIASALSIQPNQVNISATTAEGLGIVGSGKGIAASATCLLVYS